MLIIHAIKVSILIIMHVLTILIQERLRNSQRPIKAQTSVDEHEQAQTKAKQARPGSGGLHTHLSANERDQRQEQVRMSEHECKDQQMKGKVGACICQG